MADFLLEIGLDEIPARMIAGAEAELGKRVNDLLTRERLLGAAAKVTTYSTPRRLAVLVEDVMASQADSEEKLTGPSWKVAFEDGEPTAAAQAFAKKAGVAVDALEKVSNAKGEYVGATVKRLGRAASELLAAELPKEVLSLYWAKNMYWRAGKQERFVRPVRWVVALLDAEIVPVEIAGIAAGRASRGHRVLHGAAPVVLAKATDYVEPLRKAYAVVDVAERRQSIRKALDAATRTVAGARWREDEALIETVVHLTEWPTVVLGGFEPEYLELPEEVLVTVMRDHQKYFAVEGADGKLAPHFLAVLNTQVDAEGEAIIRHGNARVLRARFKDARFFWDFDQKTPLVERVESLNNVTFQKELGSYHWKTEECLKVARLLATMAEDAGVAFDKAALVNAVKLAKADLTTELVKEFTELQGVIGGLYARVQELDEDLKPDVQLAVSRAIYEHYRPESMEDAVPETLEGAVLSIADKADSIAGMFALGLVPSGSKDPFALRRQGNGMVRTIAEKKLPLRLSEIMSDARIRYKGSEAEKKFSNAGYAEAVRGFFRERLEFYLKDARGYAYDVVSAVLAVDADDVVDAAARADAVSKVRGSADFESISSAFKRMKNILRQASEKTRVIAIRADAAGLQEESEKELAALIPQTVLAVETRRAARDYEGALLKIAKLRPAIDKFFDKVMVMVDDENLRANRLALLQSVVKEFSTIADFSEIVTEGRS